MGYIVNTVQDVTVNNENEQTVTILYTMLNKKEKPSKSAAFAGFGDGLLSTIKIKNGEYYMTQDLGLAAGGENRHGYILYIPKTLKARDNIKGSTLDSEAKIMGVTVKNSLTYNNFKVEKEVDL